MKEPERSEQITESGSGSQESGLPSCKTWS
jgi:hypothetical protein